ncbi:hypothetical protein QR680_008889 [Steinernema hermaphroditum]|uniref:Uncharacterized protein n=1 Tax=Steinernema hermaphroditum TaxID=289476 RepID=A0AA39IIA2_9BILA|nr:hypothetical protein QR680_008889 [Steinernema hermaphroditum]
MPNQKGHSVLDILLGISSSLAHLSAPHWKCFSLRYDDFSILKFSQIIEWINGRVTPPEFALRPYLEIAAWTICVSMCLLVLLCYLLARKNPNFVGSLLFFIASCTLCSAIHSLESVVRILDMTYLIDALPLLDSDWLFLFKGVSIDFIYVGGTVLALDRVLVMAFPLQYSRWGVSRRLCIVASLFSVVLLLFLLTSMFFENNGSVYFSYYMATDHVGYVFDFITASEFLLHLVFFVQYNAFSKRAHVKTKVNQVALVQGISQIIFCLLPKFLSRINYSFVSREIPWIVHVTWYYQAFFAVHVLLICFVMIYKMRFGRRAKIAVSTFGNDTSSFWLAPNFQFHLSPMLVTQLEVKVRAHLECALNVLCTFVCLSGLVVYSIHPSRSSFIGSLFLHIASCTYYCVLSTVETLDLALFMQGVTKTPPLGDTSHGHGQWFFIFHTMSFDFVYVTGAGLAFDRFLVMLLKARYISWAISRKICFLVVALCSSTATLLLFCTAVFPFQLQKTSFSTTACLGSVGTFYDLVVVVEVICHVAFCVMYTKHWGRPTASSSDYLLKANHITMLHVVCQTLFCVLPKALWKLFGMGVEIVARIAIYYSVLFSTYVLLSSLSVLYMLWRRKKVVRITVSHNTPL